AMVGWAKIDALPDGDALVAMRVTGESLGMAYRGGLVVVDTRRQRPEEDDLVALQLEGQDDPDTKGPLSFRLWRPEMDGDRELALRLGSLSSVPPLTVRYPDQVIILGEVVGRHTVADLADLGLL